MSLTPKAQREVIDYYFQEPNAKAVVENGLNSNIQDVRDFLETVYEFLAKLHPGESTTEADFGKLVEEVKTNGIVPDLVVDLDKHPGVPIGRGATTADIQNMQRKT